MSDIPFHEVADLFPLLIGQDFAELKDDIAANGQLAPIWTWQGKIIDGRNRYRACIELGIEPKTQEWDGKGSLLAFVLSLNLHRRQLTSGQRAAIAVDALALLEAEAKERQREGGHKGGKSRGRKGSQKVDEPSGKAGRAADAAAKLLNTNRQYVSAMKKIKQKAPDLHELVRTGELGVSDAKSKLRKRERLRELEEQAEQAEERRRQMTYGPHRPPRPSTEDRKQAELEIRSRPEFMSRQEEVEMVRREANDVTNTHEELQEQARKLWHESRRLRKRFELLTQRLERDVAFQIELAFCDHCSARLLDQKERDNCACHACQEKNPYMFRPPSEFWPELLAKLQRQIAEENQVPTACEESHA